MSDDRKAINILSVPMPDEGHISLTKDYVSKVTERFIAGTADPYELKVVAAILGSVARNLSDTKWLTG